MCAHNKSGTIQYWGVSNLTHTCQVEERLPCDEDWLGCLIPANEWERNERTLTGKTSPICSFHSVEKTPDDRFYRVAVSLSWIPQLREQGFAVTLEGAPNRVAEPKDADIRVDGAREARRKASHSFIQNAVHGVSIGARYGLDRYYRSVTLDQHLLVPIEWAILIRDILVCLSY